VRPFRITAQQEKEKKVQKKKIRERDSKLNSKHMKSVKATRKKTEEEEEEEWNYRDETLSSAILPARSLSRSVSKIY
jgi:hypothetical protein